MDNQVKSKVARCQSEFLKIHQGKDFAKFLSIHEDVVGSRTGHLG
jgi:ribosomal protein S19